MNDTEKVISILNQIFEIEQKLSKLHEPNTIKRNIDKLKIFFETNWNSGVNCYSYSNPINEPYSETRTDCEASISGATTQNLRIIEVIKPIIRFHNGDSVKIIQKGIVVVEGETKY